MKTRGLLTPFESSFMSLPSSVFFTTTARLRHCDRFLSHLLIENGVWLVEDININWVPRENLKLLLEFRRAASFDFHCIITESSVPVTSPPARLETGPSCECPDHKLDGLSISIINGSFVLDFGAVPRRFSEVWRGSDTKLQWPLTILIASRGITSTCPCADATYKDWSTPRLTPRERIISCDDCESKCSAC